MNDTVQTVAKWQDTVIAFLVQYGFQIVGAIIILIVGLIIARIVGKGLDGWLAKHHLEPPIRLLIVRVVRLVILALVFVLVLDKFGVPIAPMIAGIGVAGVGIGLAMQGVLSNVMAGLTIIFTKPFRVGEYIEIAGVYGEITSIELFSTKLVHGDKSIITIPNRKIVGEIMHNYGTIRQLNLDVDVAYNSNVTLALSTVREILAGNPRVLKEPAATVGINALENSSINIAVQPWVKVTDYGPAQLQIYQAIVEKFRAAGIEIPFPQREVRLLQK